MDGGDGQPEWGIKISKCFIIPQRIILCIMSFFAIVNAYTMRICLSIAITQIVPERNYSEEIISSAAVCPKEELEGVKVEKDESVIIDWTQTMQGVILGSFYIGYFITHIPGGLLAEKFGGRWVLNIGIFVTAIFTLLTPLAVRRQDMIATVALRIMMGLGTGTTFPACSALLAQWVPRKERGILGSFVFGGGQFGTVLSTAVSGILLMYTTWDWVFYLFGTAAIVWCFFFWLLCYNDPLSHPFIKPTEKEYLQKEMGQMQRRDNRPPTPWKSISKSIPLWGLVAAQVGHDWGFYVMASDLPKYMNDVMQFTIKNNGIYSSLPFAAMWISSLVAGAVTDCILKKDMMSITSIRKWNTGLAAIGPAIFMVAASYAGCDRIVVVVLFTLCLFSMGPYYSGMKLGPLDMSPNYSGTIMAIANGIGAITGVLAPPIIGLLTPNTLIGEWRIVFWVSFVILVVTSIIYCFTASGEVQPWNNPTDEKKSAD